MNGVTTLILKLSGTLVLWIIIMSLMAEYIISRDINIIIQIASIMGGLLLTVGALNYMVKSIIKFINKNND